MLINPHKCYFRFTTISKKVPEQQYFNQTYDLTNIRKLHNYIWKNDIFKVFETGISMAIHGDNTIRTNSEQYLKAPVWKKRHDH